MFGVLFLYRAQVSKLLPPSLAHMSTPDQWVSEVAREWDDIASRILPMDAKAKYLSKNYEC